MISRLNLEEKTELINNCYVTQLLVCLGIRDICNIKQYKLTIHPFTSLHHREAHDGLWGSGDRTVGFEM